MKCCTGVLFTPAPTQSLECATNSEQYVSRLFYKCGISAHLYKVKTNQQEHYDMGFKTLTKCCQQRQDKTAKHQEKNKERGKER